MRRPPATVLALVLGHGNDEPTEICAHLGMKPAGIATALRRGGRPDLARAYDRTRRPRTAKAGAGVLEEVLHLAGEDPGEVARRLGMTPKAVYEALRRQGRQDLARPFGALYERQRYARPGAA